MADMEEIRRLTKRNYQFESWPPPQEQMRAHPRRFVSAPTTLAEYIHELRRALPNEGYAWTDYYRSASNPNVRFAVTIKEHESEAAAREAMIDHLAASMSPRLPRAEEKGIRVGDVAFAGHAPIQTRVLFARGNVTVEVSSTGSIDASVQAIALQLDEQLLARP